MSLKNSATHYGTVTRFLHWAVFLLLAHQYLGGNFMTRIKGDHTLFGLTQGNYYHHGLAIKAVIRVRHKRDPAIVAALHDVLRQFRQVKARATWHGRVLVIRIQLLSGLMR